jgi:[ribosomal protein S18]-alanine N-acetyltransferase
VILRPATVEDVRAVAALEQALFGADAWSAEAVRSELQDGRRTSLLAVDGDEVVGYVVVLHGADVDDLQRIAVVASRRRSGLATRLLAAVPQERPMLLEVAAGNAAALAFYAAEGFTEIHRRPRYYRDGSDAVVLERRASR